MESRLSALRYAAKSDCGPIFQFLLHDMDPPQRTALHHATILGAKDLIDILLQHGRHIEPEDCEGYTPLQLARYHDQPHLACCLIDRGAALLSSCCFVSRSLVALLHIAAMDGNTTLNSRLAATGIPLELVDDNGDTALMCAIRTSNSNVVLELIKLGCHWGHMKAFAEAVDNRDMLKVMPKQLYYPLEIGQRRSVRLVTETLEYAKSIETDESVKVLQSWVSVRRHSMESLALSQNEDPV